MSEKMREEFEAWAMNDLIQNEGHTEDSAKDFLYRPEGGYYSALRYRGAWQGWQASRQSLEVELPSAICKENGFDCEENEDDESYNLALSHCAIQIRAAGIRIKVDL